jgi:hypothetical protein
MRMKIPPLRPRDSYKEAGSQGEASYRLVEEAESCIDGSR